VRAPIPSTALARETVQRRWTSFAELTDRALSPVRLCGAADAERVIVIMGSGAEAVEETVHYLNQQGEKVGVLKVRLYRPFDTTAFVNALPATTQSIAVLDRTKEPGATGEPLYLDVVSALVEMVAGGTAPFAVMPRIIGGRYGLSSKEFTPAMVKAVYDELAKPVMKNHFTIGIDDDVTHTSLDFDEAFSTESDDVVRAVFFGLGSDGTVGANKNSIKIIGENTPNFAQAYFVYDSKKSGAVTVSHLRFGPRPIRSTYLISKANFIACHQFHFLERFDMLRLAEPGATFLLNSHYGPDQVWDHLPREVQETIIEKKLRFFVIDGLEVAHKTNMGRRINTIMQTCFFALIGLATSTPLLSRERAIDEIKHAIEKTYGKRGEAVVEQNFAAVDAALSHLHEVSIPEAVTSTFTKPPVVSSMAPDFVQAVTAPMIAGLGDTLPVSALPVDGTYPSGTTQWEKRNIATEVPIWDPEICIQCGKCAFVCPHAVIRLKLYDPQELAGAPEGFRSAPARFKEYKELAYTLQISPEDCTGCSLCYEVCPVKNKRQPKFKAINLVEYTEEIRETERASWDFFQQLPNVDREELQLNQVKYNQLLEPLFEFSGACAGCGETPYLKLITQLFGDRMLVANATGCSSIYGGNLPTTPWARNAEGRGPAWSNSLFEDNAEFGLGMRMALDQRLDAATHLLRNLRETIGPELASGMSTDDIIFADQITEAEILLQRKRVQLLKERITAVLSGGESLPAAIRNSLEDLRSIADVFVKKSVWIVGGDGWAYDIGYGGLDHVMASGRNVNVLVLDTEVYSNTGGQMSKSTPRGAVAKFAAAGKPLPKKDLGMLAMTYGNVYVAKVAFGANDRQTVQAILEAEAYDGPSLIIAYSHCIAHGYDLKFGLEQQQAAVDSGHWVLYRYNPELALEPADGTSSNGRNPFHIDSKEPSLPLEKYIYREGRYRMLQQSNPETADRLLKMAKADVRERWDAYQKKAAPDHTAK
jgi:pyruvate-ferredoxin/flavodoxin oxidoreductase